MIIDLKSRLLEEARGHLLAGDSESAVPLLEKVVRFARGDDEAVKFAHVTLAAHYFEQGDPRSVHHFRAALEIDGEDDRVRYCLGHAHLDSEQYGDAVREFALALEGRPGDAEYLRSLGVALAEDGRLEEALSRLRAAARARPNEPFILKDLAQVLGAFTRYDEAIPLLERAVRLAPDEPFFGEVLEEFHHLSEVERLAGQGRARGRSTKRRSVRRPRKL